MEIKEYTVFNEDEIKRLYIAVGWKAYTDDMAALRRGYENSLIVLGAYEEDTLIGIIRAVGDGSTVVFIQDILVFPEKQRAGVGTALIKAVLERYKNVRQIQLTTDNTPKAMTFYRSLDFWELSEAGLCGLIKM